MSDLNQFISLLISNFKKHLSINREFTHAIKPLNIRKMSQKNPSSYDFKVDLPILHTNRLPNMIICIQKNHQHPLKLIEHWYINRYQQGSIVVNQLAKEKGVRIVYSPLPHSSRLGISVIKDCSLSSLSQNILNFVFATISIANYLQVNSYLDGPNALDIQKLNL